MTRYRIAIKMYNRTSKNFFILLQLKEDRADANIFTNFATLSEAQKYIVDNNIDYSNFDTALYAAVGFHIPKTPELVIEKFTTQKSIRDIRIFV